MQNTDSQDSRSRMTSFCSYYRTQFGSPGVFSNFFKLKMFTDARIASAFDRDLAIHCHRVILSAVSNVLKSKFLQSEANGIVFVEMRHNSLMNLLKLIYDGKVKVRRSEREEFAAALRVLNIRAEEDTDCQLYQDEPNTVPDYSRSEANSLFFNRGVIISNQAKSEGFSGNRENFGFSDPPKPVPPPAPRFSMTDERSSDRKRPLSYDPSTPSHSRYTSRPRMSDEGVDTYSRLPRPSKVKMGNFGKTWLKLTNPNKTTQYGIKDKYVKYGLHWTGGSLEEGEDLYMAFNEEKGAEEALNIMAKFEPDTKLVNVTHIPHQVKNDFQFSSEESKVGLRRQNPITQVGQFESPNCFNAFQGSGNDFSLKTPGSSMAPETIGRLYLKHIPGRMMKLHLQRLLKTSKFRGYNQDSMKVQHLDDNMSKAMVEFYDHQELRNAVQHFEKEGINGGRVEVSADF